MTRATIVVAAVAAVVSAIALTKRGSEPATCPPQLVIVPAAPVIHAQPPPPPPPPVPVTAPPPAVKEPFYWVNVADRATGAESCRKTGGACWAMRDAGTIHLTCSDRLTYVEAKRHNFSVRRGRRTIFVKLGTPPLQFDEIDERSAFEQAACTRVGHQW